MATYNDIKQAFAKYCESSRQLHSDANAIGKMLIEKIPARGQFPNNVFRPYPANLENYDKTKSFDTSGAMTYNTQNGLWQLGAVLDVSTDNGFSFSQILRMMFTIDQRKKVYLVALAASEVSVSIAPNDTLETQAALDSFADRVLEAIVEHYATMRDKWLDAGPVGEIGFHTSLNKNQVA